MLKSCCKSSLSEDIGQCYFLLLQVYCLSSSLKEVFLARHAIFCFDHNSRTFHDLMQLLKTSDRKMVMYNIASNLYGIFRRALSEKLTTKSRQAKIKLALQRENALS